MPSSINNPLTELAGAVDVVIDRRRFMFGMCATVALAACRTGGAQAELVRKVSSPRQTTQYIERGPADGPLTIFLHGWPELSLVWRAQIDAFAAEGWHCIAPDMCGYGGSSAPESTAAYTIQEVVADMAELHDHLGGKPAIWVGHDWGSVVAGALVAHEARRSRGVVLVSVPYFPDANALPTLVPLVDPARACRERGGPTRRREAVESAAGVVVRDRAALPLLSGA